MTLGLFSLPDEALLEPVIKDFPGREAQIRALASFLHPDGIISRNIVIHGTEATGKSAITTRLLRTLSSSPTPHNSSPLCHATVNAAQCITARHLYERIVDSVAQSVYEFDSQGRGGDALGRAVGGRRCETLAQLSVELCELLKYPRRGEGWRFVLVVDGVDRQRDAPVSLVPALARLSEIIPCLTTIFILTATPASLLHTPSPHIHFPPYSKPDFIHILSLSPPAPLATISGVVLTQQETSDLYARFCAAVHDALIKSASRTLPAMKYTCRMLWPRFVEPLVKGVYTGKEFSKLLVAARSHFQDESLLNPSIVSIPTSSKETTNGSITHLATKTKTTSAADLTSLLPTTARLLLVSAYLASHNAPRHDLTLFSTHFHARKRRRGGGYVTSSHTPSTTPTKHRKVARKLLGAHTFILERMLAIFEAMRNEWVNGAGMGVGFGAYAGGGVDGDVGMAIATLASLKLVVRVGGAGDVLDRGGKWRIGTGWEVIRGVGRSIGIEVEEWLIE